MYKMTMAGLHFILRRRPNHPNVPQNSSVLGQIIPFKTHLETPHCFEQSFPQEEKVLSFAYFAKLGLIHL